MKEQYDNDKLIAKCQALLEVNNQLRLENDILVNENEDKEAIKEENKYLRKEIKQVKEVEQCQFRNLVDDISDLLKTKDFISIH